MMVHSKILTLLDVLLQIALSNLMPSKLNQKISAQRFSLIYFPRSINSIECLCECVCVCSCMCASAHLCVCVLSKFSE